MSENKQGPPAVPINKPKGTTNESKTPPPLPKAKIIAITSPQDETGSAKSDTTTGKKLPPKLPGKKSNTPPPLVPTMDQKETGSDIIDAASGKKLPPKLPNRKSKTPPPLAPSIPQNARQNKFSPNSQTSNTATTQTGNKGKGKLFLFVIGVAAALIAIISISNGSGNDVPLDRGHAFDYSDDEEDDSEDSDVGYSEPEAQPTPEPETYDASNYNQTRVTSEKIICPNCNGTGDYAQTCNKCNRDNNCYQQTGGGYYVYSSTKACGSCEGEDNCATCHDCNGTGQVKKSCNVCNGSGRVDEYQ